eukprot:scaffold2742_cov130-Isochrysis_galbana.AAC.19
MPLPFTHAHAPSTARRNSEGPRPRVKRRALPRSTRAEVGSHDRRQTSWLAWPLQSAKHSPSPVALQLCRRAEHSVCAAVMPLRDGARSLTQATLTRRPFSPAGI